ncbi:MAG TPA: sporulation integral membrane protein YlbJ [Bacillota bacterium]|jgi:sporulation integral membrane protein YlbJ|nr:sporulation integral membrane protein YlbJ [Bacillota bacterium]HOJ57695.1 sporulation integral membrane protein YlbJ [Bacillota bacterium]HOL02012.1 sporulation integral membrane protein YlbJ [Bacillota bacterium]HPO79754.1 sporulation integral membrane protein YlbJ [Bacillota bacterium]HPU60815.1 sporulation integral membrane protein YlbJ [Bacillota bacterium]
MIMRPRLTQRSAYLMAGCALFITIMILLYPSVAFRASIEGLRVWWEIVFPALLPFFVAAEVLMAFGVVHFIGVLLEPLMRPVFDVPGVGAFALAMGITGGYPIGAKITASLRRKGLCNQIEGERLASFTNTADPLFMSGAVAVGMFQSPELGGIISGVHYISAVIVGILLRLHGRTGSLRVPERDVRTKGNLFKRAKEELDKARQADGRPVGQVFGDSVRDSISSLLVVGGFIMMFSVIIEVLTTSGILKLVEASLVFIARPLKVKDALISPMIRGFFEITLGTELASKAQAPLLDRLVITNAIIAWSGLSVFGQVSAMVSGTDIRMTPYFVSRFIHAAIAAAITVVSMSPYGQGIIKLVSPVFVMGSGIAQAPYYLRLLSSFTKFLTIIAVMVALSVALWLIQRIQLVFIRVKGVK